ncbi:TonB-linked SusC/RagA family outer membrane protein [Pedobacter sp. CAN_A7]|uniref:SusC/RagA family TonB-linked outer membrane protein n=1 Tax=Pedobacter sp. CAN_A7 TaxID=2787722 RepID=UPI0018CBE1AE
MKRTFTLSMLSLLFFWSHAVMAQTKEIRGKVSDSENAQTLPGVVVKLKGSTAAVATNNDGQYAINVPGAGGTLTFSYVGYITKEIQIGAQTVVNVSLVPNSEQLSEVVVTALGIKRDPRSLGYSAQTVTGEDLTENRQPNVVNALQGKVAGVTISSTGGAPGQGARIQIRGVNSIDPARDNQPLFVIDGIFMDNSTSNTGSGAYGMSNRAVDLNPDDIESMNILRGGAATALYGLRGANGVVVITTKSGKAGNIKIDYQGTFGIENVNTMPELQTKYSQGWRGVYNKDDFWPSYGPTVEVAKAEDPTHPDKLYNHMADAFKTGSQYRNGVTVSGGTEKMTFLTSISQLQHNGVLPSTDFKNHQGRLNATFKPSEKFNAGASINVSNSGGYRYNAGRYIEQLIYWSPRHDVNDYLMENGTMRSYGETTNPRYLAETNRFSDDVLRLIGSANASYQPFKWLNLSYRAGIDTYRDNRLNTAPGFQGLVGERLVEDNGTAAFPGEGLVNNYNGTFRSINSTFIASLTHTVSKDLSGTLRLGHDLYNRKTYNTSMEGSDLTVYNWYSLSNAKFLTGTTDRESYRLMGIFGELSLNWREYLYLTITGRNDVTSSLLSPNNSFFYPSASLSYIFSDHIKLPEVISSAKFKLSYAQIGKDANAYSTSRGYSNYTGLPTGYTGFTRPALLGSPSLKPEFTNTYEGGLSMRFLNSRVGFDANYYHSLSKDQIINVPISSSTGYVTAAVNAGSMRNKGFELTISGTPVKTSDFSWETSLNYSANRNKIVSLRSDLTEIVGASEHGYLNARVTMKLIPGEAYGTLYGTEYRRYFTPAEIAAGLDKSTEASDPSRPLLIGANGFPIIGIASDQKKLGNVQPTWIGGWNNTFNYKDLSLNVLFDARIGHERYNQLANYYAAFGMSKESENRNDHKVFQGVLADGSVNTKEVWLGQGIDPSTQINYGDGYYRLVKRGASEDYVEDASWVRLRSVTLGYSLPKQWIERSFVKNIKLSVTGNNLILWTKYSGFDPESTTTNSGSNIDGFAGMTYPAVRSFLFSLNVGF